MNTIYEFLAACRERPALYPVTNADDMFIFLQGYIAGSIRGKSKVNAKELEHFARFGAWLQKEAKLESNVGWQKTIVLLCADKRESLDTFFQLLDKYKVEHPML